RGGGRWSLWPGIARAEEGSERAILPQQRWRRDSKMRYTMAGRVCHRAQRHEAPRVTSPKQAIILALHALVAQLDRASDFESEGREFESLRARQITFCNIDIFHLPRSTPN